MSTNASATQQPGFIIYESSNETIMIRAEHEGDTLSQLFKTGRPTDAITAMIFGLNPVEGVTGTRDPALYKRRHVKQNWVAVTPELCVD